MAQDEILQLAVSPYLRAVEAKFDAEWLGWGRPKRELWATAEALGLVLGTYDVHPGPQLEPLCGPFMSPVREQLPRLVLATFVRLGCPERKMLSDRSLAQELGISIYLLFVDQLEDLVKLARDAGRSVASDRSGLEGFCTVHSLCLALGAYAKELCEETRLGAVAKVDTGGSAPTRWQWADGQTLQAMMAELSPKIHGIPT